MNKKFKLGRSIALFVPFYRKLHKKREEIFSSKILIIMAVIASKSCCLSTMANLTNNDNDLVCNKNDL